MVKLSRFNKHNTQRAYHFVIDCSVHFDAVILISLIYHVNNKYTNVYMYMYLYLLF